MGVVVDGKQKLPKERKKTWRAHVPMPLEKQPQTWGTVEKKSQLEKTHPSTPDTSAKRCSGLELTRKSSIRDLSENVKRY
jgi:hypothetical protein